MLTPSFDKREGFEKIKRKEMSDSLRYTLVFMPY